MTVPARFQSFDDTADKSVAAPRLGALRRAMAARGLAALIVPRADVHQNEYVPANEDRLRFLLGFTGSAGTAVVTATEALLFVDGRYTLQAAQEVDTALVTVVAIAETSLEDWIGRTLKPGQLLGVDAWRTPQEALTRLEKAAGRAGAMVSPREDDLLADIWTNRPPAPQGRVVLQPVALSGEAPADKLERIRAELEKARVDALLVTDPHALAWTFDIRGADVPHTPLVLGFALIPREGRPTLFIDDAKLDTETRDVLDALAIRFAPADLLPALDRLIAPGQRVRLDRATAAAALHQRIRANGATVDEGPDPITLMKAVKNPVEREGIRAAHRRDGAALVRFLAWFDAEAPKGGLTEIDAVEKLEACRAETGALMDVAFPTIAGSGPNGAIVHYRVTRASNRTIGPGELFLLDSGAQYRDGTTDVTRTLAVGFPTDAMRRRYTDVLRGHLAISRAVFPKGTTGAQLDPFARQFLWAEGLDYEHGTGHGVGAYLSVHEGPQRISKLGHVALERGMLLSNEPGYYKTGAFGIRIENLVLVTEAPVLPGAEKEMNAFETVTLAPYDRRLIDLARLDASERAFIDAYHARVRAELTPLIGEAADWLEAATAPL